MISIDTRELENRIRAVTAVGHSRSGGPGGQNVNKVNTRVTLHVPVAALGLTEGETERVRRALRGRVNGNDELVVHSSETRSQARNREAAYARATAMIGAAAEAPPQQRKPTRPGRAARERRLETKRRRSTTKNLRRRPPTWE